MTTVLFTTFVVVLILLVLKIIQPFSLSPIKVINIKKYPCNGYCVEIVFITFREEKKPENPKDCLDILLKEISKYKFVFAPKYEMSFIKTGSEPIIGLQGYTIYSYLEKEKKFLVKYVEGIKVIDSFERNCHFSKYDIFAVVRKATCPCEDFEEREIRILERRQLPVAG